MNIKQIRISGFKSIVDMELNELTPYSVFAGANGSGKSNFFDALKFVSMGDKVDPIVQTIFYLV